MKSYPLTRGWPKDAFIAMMFTVKWMWEDMEHGHSTQNSYEDVLALFNEQNYCEGRFHHPDQYVIVIDARGLEVYPTTTYCKMGVEDEGVTGLTNDRSLMWSSEEQQQQHKEDEEEWERTTRELPAMYDDIPF